MSNRQIIAVVGATGAQGGGLCRAILNDPDQVYACRAITRDPAKVQATALAARGATVVKADLDDVRSLTAAFAGADAAYCVTNFWEHYSAERETAQAKNLAQAARATGVKHVIWSTLEDTRALMAADDARMPFLLGRYRVPHFDAKAEADAAFADLPSTYFIASFYWDNLLTSGLRPQKGEDGVYSWTLPMAEKRLAGIAADDLGRVAYGIFKGGQQYVGQRIGAASEHLTIDEMGAQLSKVLGIGPIRYHAVSADAYRALGFPGASELGNMFQVYRDFEGEVNGLRDTVLTRRLYPGLLTFEQFLIKHKDRIPV